MSIIKTKSTNDYFYSDLHTELHEHVEDYCLDPSCIEEYSQVEDKYIKTEEDIYNHFNTVNEFVKDMIATFLLDNGAERLYFKQFYYFKGTKIEIKDYLLEECDILSANGRIDIDTSDSYLFSCELGDGNCILWKLTKCIPSYVIDPSEDLCELREYVYEYEGKLYATFSYEKL